MAIARRRGERIGERTSGIVVGGTETARARQKQSEKKRRIQARERKKCERQKGRKRKRQRAEPGKRERGAEGGEKGQGEVGQEDEGGTKYRRRTAVGIKRGDGGPTLFPVEDWTAPLPSLWRPSCPPMSSFLPSGCSFFSSSSSARTSVRACVRASDSVVCVHVPRVLLYRPTLYLTSSPTRVPRARARECASASGSRERARPLVAPDDAATRHAARPRTMLDRIIPAGPLYAKAVPQWDAERTSLRSRMRGVECAGVPADLCECKPLSHLTICYATIALRAHCRISFVH